MGYAIRNIASLPFGTLIGGPLSAAVEAQAAAAKTTIDFIQVVGFEPKDEDSLFPLTGEPDIGNVRNITFSYKMKNADNVEQDASLTVPILTIVPIPYIRVDEMDIDFVAKITEQFLFSHEAQATTNYASTTSGGYRHWWSPWQVNFRAAYSSRHSSKTESSSRFQTEMTMNVHVKAVQDDLPAGLSRVLNILESSIRETKETA